MIDEKGYRQNVGIIIINAEKKVFWGRRIGQKSWQFPQGGIDEAESAQDAMYRELHEEVGLRPQHVELVAETEGWLHYELPKKFRRKNTQPLCIGQKQKWFLLRLVASEAEIDFNQGKKAEFDAFRWVDYWYPVRKVIYFKRCVYRSALAEFARTVGIEQQRAVLTKPSKPAKHLKRTKRN
ncbi:RNA pyrophosphohydrolase [Ostreibacterium oceani]|uniref:RNA pyrophosphohydrolase n=1 Tax=Ostreibacterium oceani TaxID=2654998 RepID=A0A6N7EY32_9GAMM|nr:RNA pyrophosphohydrolase [Ostreibacterium oceani]